MKKSLSARTPAVLWRATPVAAAVAAVLASGGAAQAQQAAPAATETPAVVTVTGIRRGIESAINVKKNADQIVEAISAEDLGKLPDISIAESVSRLPGVSAQRTAGRASQISIRGTPPDFATSLLNGREQASTGDSRSVEFDQYPAELLGGVKIYKTPEGALVGQGLSGTVDMQTVRPLDFANRQVALSYRKNKLNVGGAGTEGDGDRFAISYVDQFLDRKLGVAIGFARLDEQGGSTARFDSWGGGKARLNGNPANPELNVPYNGFGIFADQENRKRDGVAATLQYRPSKDFNTTLDVFHSTFDKVKTTTGFQAPLNDSWNGTFNYDVAGVLTEATTSGSDVTTGVFNNVRAVVRNDSESTKDENLSIGWNTQFKVGGFTAIADLSHSKAERRGGIIETTAGTAQSTLGTAQLDTVRFTNTARFTPGLNYADRSIIRLTDVQGWGGGTAQPQAGYSKLPKVEDVINGLRLALKTDVSWGPLVSVEGGVHASKREKERSFTEGRLVILGDTTGLGSASVPGSATTAIPMPGGGTISVASFDSSESVGSIYRVERKLNADIFNKDWFVEEKVNTFYAKGDIDSQLFGAGLRGNVGLQFVQTDQSSRAFNVDRRTCTSDFVCPAPEFTEGTTYTDVLPSLNLNWDLGNAGIVRLGLAQVMARPKVDDMRASRTFDFNANENRFTGSGGNPKLEPFRANQIDLSYEKYFGSKAYIGIAGFYKDLKTFIVSVTDRNYDFRRFLPPGAVIPPAPPGVTDILIGSFTQPVNGSGGRISGIELSANFPLNMVSSALDGFGFFVNHSDTSSSINIPTQGVSVDSVATPNIPLPGLSERVTNYAVYFEKWGFSARVAARKRSDFVGEVADFAGDRRLTYIKGETITDVQVGYEFQSGALKGLSIRGEMSNADNTPFIRYRGGDPNVLSNQVENKRDGKYYQVGLNYKF
ncbi:MAG: TonB-dependent receptor [Ideonella sp. WA131b]|jgi:iron complex outermembrane receptor protein|nr:TonB-dependent receptor [Ideonella sp. WA131b]